jgi:hypothetical protein
VAVAAEVSKDLAFLAVQVAAQVETHLHQHNLAVQELQVKELMVV